MTSPSPNPSANPPPPPKRTFWDSLEQQPFKITIMINTLALIYSFIIVAWIAMWLGPYDFGVPLKWVFFFATISSLLTLANEFYTAARIKSFEHIWHSLERISLQIAFFITSIISLVNFFDKSLAVGSLLSLDPTTRVVMTIAAFSPVIFTLKPLRELKNQFVYFVKKMFA